MRCLSLAVRIPSLSGVLVTTSVLTVPLLTGSLLTGSLAAQPFFWTSAATTVTAETTSTNPAHAGIVGRGPYQGVVGISTVTGITGQFPAGVQGSAAGYLGAGVRGTAVGTLGYGVWGVGLGAGVRGASAFGGNRGVLGEARSTNVTDNVGVEGQARTEYVAGGRGTGVFGSCFGPSNIKTTAVGVKGIASSVYGPRGVEGEAMGYSAIGVRGTVFAKDGYGVFSFGNLGVTGSKAFLQPHPTDASKAIRFVCLEGNESGTYFRGKARLVGGRAEIEIPASWRLASEADRITVQATPVDAPARLWVPVQTREKIVVRGDVDCAFTYVVNGVRRGYRDLETIVANEAFRPTVRGIPHGARYPAALRDLLVRNGILNPDYTPNEATAARLGWKLRDPDTVPTRERWWRRPD